MLAVAWWVNNNFGSRGFAFMYNDRHLTSREFGEIWTKNYMSKEFASIVIKYNIKLFYSTSKEI